MIEVVFMSLAINILGTREVFHLRKEMLQQPAPVKQIKTYRRLFAEYNFIKLIGNAFLGNDLNTLMIPYDRIKCFRVKFEVQL